MCAEAMREWSFQVQLNITVYIINYWLTPHPHKLSANKNWILSLLNILFDLDFCNYPLFISFKNKDFIWKLSSSICLCICLSVHSPTLCSSLWSFLCPSVELSLSVCLPACLSDHLRSIPDWLSLAISI